MEYELKEAERLERANRYIMEQQVCWLFVLSPACVNTDYVFCWHVFTGGHNSLDICVGCFSGIYA